MSKYFYLFLLTLKESFIYRINFLLWRFRSIVLILVLYFLWEAAIPQGQTVFGYDQSKILTYILGISVIRSMVMVTRSADIAGQIASGSLTNDLIKPVSIIKLWLAKDIADKLLNILFSFFEIFIIILILKPTLLLPQNLLFITLTLVAILIGIFLFFFLSFIISLIAFWTPENPWPARFLITVIVDFLSGGFFPLDILPSFVFNSLKLTPFPYLIFFPLEIYLGRLNFIEIFSGLLVSLIWTAIFIQLTKFFLTRGLKNYSAWGR